MTSGSQFLITEQVEGFNHTQSFGWTLSHKTLIYIAYVAILLQGILGESKQRWKGNQGME